MVVTLVSVLTIFFYIPLSADETIENTMTQEKHNEKERGKFEEVLEKLSELSEQRLSDLSEERDGTLQRLNTNDIEQELLELGVDKLSQEDLNELNEKANDDISINATTPPSTDSVDWYSYRMDTYHEGDRYEVQQLFAMSKTSDSNLANGADGVHINTGENLVLSTIEELASVYVQKIIGTIPVVQWTPYELLGPEYEQVTLDTHQVTYRSTQTVIFAYVKPYGTSDSNQELSFVSNRVDLAHSHTFAGIDNQGPYSKPTDEFNLGIPADEYGSINAAVSSYLTGYGTQSSFVEDYRFYDHNQEVAVTQPVLNPFLPGHIH